ncbi:MAG: hypothetical protein M1826_006222 [Phylliscum demangeonii]|nr:MAG: hypothetical protein M1826_006222 [Phylliscum demangeonii]
MFRPIHVSNQEGKYRRIDTIGEGSWAAAVILVKRKEDGKKMVEKQFKVKDGKEMAWGEMDVLRRLFHRNIVEYVDGFITDHPPAASMYMEWCDLGTLDDLIRYYWDEEIPMPESFVRHVFISLADALAYCQTGVKDVTQEMKPTSKVEGWRTVIHSDLKANNVFLTSAGAFPSPYPRVVLGDFGMALRKGDPKYAHREFLGAVLIAPPESPACSRKTDIWCLGAVMQIMCRLDHGPIVTPPHPDLMEEWLKYPEHSYRPRGAGRYYTPELNRVLRYCQSFRPKTRPPAAKLALFLRMLSAQSPVPLVPLPPRRV